MAGGELDHLRPNAGFLDAKRRHGVSFRRLLLDDSTTVPGAGEPSESVTFTPADTTDYYTVLAPLAWL